jgi:hypothetical protein
MSDVWFGVLLTVTVCLVLVALVALARVVRRSGRAGPAIGAAMAAYDEAVHVTAHDSFVELQDQRERPVARATPDRR